MMNRGTTKLYMREGGKEGTRKQNYIDHSYSGIVCPFGYYFV